MVRKSEVRKLFESGAIKGYLPPKTAELKIKINNMGNYTGVVFINPGEHEKGMPLPVLNLDTLYEQVKDCNDIIEAGVKSAALVKEFRDNVYIPDVNFDSLSKMMETYDEMRDRLYLSAVSQSYKSDIAVIYNVHGMNFVPKVMLSQNGNESMVTTLPKKAIKDMGLSEEEFYNKVCENTKNILKPEIKTMHDIFNEYNNDNNSLGFWEHDADTDMLIVTSKSKINGSASLMLDDIILSQISDKYNGRNYFILPSSTNEFITMPIGDYLKETAGDIAYMMQMVEMVNDTEVSSDEILSYNVYHYDSEKHNLEKATDYCINKQMELEQNKQKVDDKIVEQIDCNNNIKF